MVQRIASSNKTEECFLKHFLFQTDIFELLFLFFQTEGQLCIYLSFGLAVAERLNAKQCNQNCYSPSAPLCYIGTVSIVGWFLRGTSRRNSASQRHSAWSGASKETLSLSIIILPRACWGSPPLLYFFSIQDPVNFIGWWEAERKEPWSHFFPFLLGCLAPQGMQRLLSMQARQQRELPDTGCGGAPRR